MIWACRLRFITYWMNVGRKTRSPAPMAVQTRLPSAFPMMSSCRRFPLWVPKGFPGVRVIVRSSPCGSTRITVSPARSGPAGLRPSITAAPLCLPSPSAGRTRTSPCTRAPRRARILSAPPRPPPPPPPPVLPSPPPPFAYLLLQPAERARLRVRGRPAERAFCRLVPGFLLPPGRRPLLRKGDESPPAFPALEGALVALDPGRG